jgi:hypothetical protein
MEKDLRELREMIIERVLCEMAFDREAWQEHLMNYLKGASREFYKARLVEKNFLATQQDIDHWDLEVESILDSFVEVYFRPLKNGQSKQKAYKEVQREFNRIDVERRRKATRIIEKYFAKSIDRKLSPIDDDDTFAFWKLVQDTIEMKNEE